MALLQKISGYLSKWVSSKKELDPAAGYDIWATDYDAQPGNLMLALDEQLFTELFNDSNIKDKIIADIGCGTGRHWQKIMSAAPAKLIGVDVSENMLAMLQKKFPLAATHLTRGHSLQPLPDGYCDIIISTLTIAHIENVAAALQEWTRILKPGGSIILTDYHPAALAKGARRTFSSNGKTLAVKNYIHSIDKITALLKQLNIQQLRLIEKNIDNSMRHYYEKQAALPVFEKWKGTPVIYALLLQKDDLT